MTRTRGRARIGVFVPFTNLNLEPDMAMLAPPGVSVHVARLGGYDIDEIPDGEQMAGLGASDLTEPLRLLAGARPDVILYGCTSATLSHGPGFDRDLAARIKAETGAETVTAAGALVHALNKASAKTIAFASPYVESLNNQAIAFLAESGLKAISRADWPEPLGNYGQGALTPDQIKALARRADNPGADALVLSCTDMRAAEVAPVLEQELGKPVICSNRAMMAQAVEILEITDS